MTESEMKAQLDGNFFAFIHDNHKGTYVQVKAVPKSYVPNYQFENPCLVGSKRGAWSRRQMMAERSAKIWTAERQEELIRLRALHGYGEKRLAKIMGISRGEIVGQLKRLRLNA